MIEILKYILLAIAIGVAFYIVSRLQMIAWLQVLEEHFTSKYKSKKQNNEQKEKK